MSSPELIGVSAALPLESSNQFGMTILINDQIASRRRVADHGEVFTNEREVSAMLDLVKQETERIDSRFLEPACGTGNFLSEILKRKLTVVEDRYGRSQLEYERNAVLAVSSVYGIDILEDNIDLCRSKLLDVFSESYTRLFRHKAKEACKQAVKFILTQNIVWGDALTLATVDAEPRPIVFSEWSFARGSLLKRRSFIFQELLPRATTSSNSLFPESEEVLQSDLGHEAFIPVPIKEYPLIHFLRVADAEHS